MPDPGPLRPGARLGPQPERRDTPAGRVERAARSTTAALSAHRPGRRRRLEAFVAAVSERGAELGREGDDALGKRVEALRHQLSRLGSADAHLPETFALVRELARRTLGTPHYDVQLMGGQVMARGELAEMATGEGKTLTATLPACAAALAGIPVHVVSVNDYLVERDAAAMGPLYRALGLSVGTITEGERDPGRKRAAYACDVTYGTAKQIAFDYLRDRLAAGRRRGPAPWPGGPHRGPDAATGPLQRGLCFAIVDEADSVLIDDAGTPLILAGGGTSADQRRAYRTAVRLARALEPGPDFRVAERERRVELTERGRERLAELARPLKGFWSGPRRREEWGVRALCALHLFRRDHEYLVRDGAVQIIDPSTGRVAPDRSWERGLHQLIEVKESCEITPERETLARISTQHFFRRYLRLSGMTGTAREVARELSSVYGLDTVAIPTRRPQRRQQRGTWLLPTLEAKWDAVVESAARERDAGRPVLIGTGSVAESEALGQRLVERGLAARVLNARHDAAEARLVAAAGGAGRITVATAMAGRGTDIALAPGVAERGGLHVIAAWRAEARRIDRQLFGRCARQGDPGSSEAILSLEDPSMARCYPPRLRGLLRLWIGRRGSLRGRAADCLSRIAQMGEENRCARNRRGMLRMEESLGDLLAFSGPGE